MLRRIIRFLIEFETPLDVRIVGLGSFRPHRPSDEQRDEEDEVGIGCLQAELLDDPRNLRILTYAKPLTAFGAKQAVVGDV